MKKSVITAIFLALLFTVAQAEPHTDTVEPVKVKVGRLPDLNMARCGHSIFCVNGEINEEKYGQGIPFPKSDQVTLTVSAVAEDPNATRVAYGSTDATWETVTRYSLSKAMEQPLRLR